MKNVMTYTCAEGIEIMEVDGEWLIMDTNHFTVTQVNVLGAIIVEALKEGKSLVEILTIIQELYDVHEETALADITAFIEEDLIQAGVVTK